MPAPYSVMRRLAEPMPTGSPMEQLGGQPSGFQDYLENYGGRELLLGLGSGLLQGRNLREGLGLGAQLGLQFQNQAQRTKAYDKRQQLQDQQYQRQVEEQDRQRRQQELEQSQWDQFLSTRPPEEQKYARFDPQGYRKQISEQMFPEAPKPMSELAQIQSDIKAGLLSPEAGQAAIKKATYIAPQTPAAPRDSYRVLTGEEAAKYGLQPGTVASMGSNGKIDILQKPEGATGNFRLLSGDEAKELGFAPGTVVGIDPKTGKPDVLQTPKASTTVFGPNGEPIVEFGGQGGAKAPSGYRFNQQGTLDAIPGGPAERQLAEKQQEQLTDLADAKKTFETLQDLVRKQGINILPGADKGTMASQYGFARAALTKLLNTGVLQPGELPVLEQILQDPTSMARIPAAIMGQADDQILAQLDTVMKKLDERGSTLKQGLPSPSGLQQPQVSPQTTVPAQMPMPDKPPVRIQGDAEFDQLPSGALFIGPDGKTRRKP